MQTLGSLQTISFKGKAARVSGSPARRKKVDNNAKPAATRKPGRPPGSKNKPNESDKDKGSKKRKKPDNVKEDVAKAKKNIQLHLREIVPLLCYTEGNTYFNVYMFRVCSIRNIPIFRYMCFILAQG